MLSSSAERPGFVLLEAVVALMIIALVGVAAVSVAGGELRTSDRATRLLEARALAEDRLSALRFLDNELLTHLPDSLEEGRFALPFDDYQWTALANEVRDEQELFDVSVEVQWPDGAYRLDTRMYRPRPLARGAE
jgi:type II secretory pathway pseudopilin PulG